MPVCAFDTNILAYAAGVVQSPADRRKVGIADALLTEALLNEVVVLPVQVCLELHNLLVRKARWGRDSAAAQVREYMDGLEIVASDPALLAVAFDLADRHQFQTYDAAILAAAAQAGCDTLYSEDMQNGFEWNGVRIVDPFT